MTELIVAGFDGTRRATEVLHQLERLDENWTIDLRDAVAVYRTDDGKLRVDQSVHATSREGATWGGLLGALLGGILAAPFTAGASAAVAAAAVGTGVVTLGATGAIVGGDEAATWKEGYGVSEEFVKQVGGIIQPRQSAVFVLVQASDPDAIAERFRGSGGRILRTTLSEQQAAKLQRVLAADQPATH